MILAMKIPTGYQQRYKQNFLSMAINIYFNIETVKNLPHILVQLYGMCQG